MEPTKKSYAIESLLTAIAGGTSRQDVIGSGQCMGFRFGGCKGENGIPNLNFRTGLDEKEYCISGFCQACQDDIFAPRCDSCGQKIPEDVLDKYDGYCMICNMQEEDQALMDRDKF